MPAYSRVGICWTCLLVVTSYSNFRVERGSMSIVRWLGSTTWACMLCTTNLLIMMRSSITRMCSTIKRETHDCQIRISSDRGHKKHLWCIQSILHLSFICCGCLRQSLVAASPHLPAEKKFHSSVVHGTWIQMSPSPLKSQSNPGSRLQKFHTLSLKWPA
jgi:hypothetical protein